MATISVTERQLFKRCRRKWDYSSFSRQSLSPVINSPALDLGTLIHATLAEWTSDPDLNPIEIYTQLSNKYLQNLIENYTQHIGCKPSKNELMPTLEAIILGKSIITNYASYWHTPLPPGFTLVDNEQTITTPIIGTHHCICKQTNNAMCGKYGCACLTDTMWEPCTCAHETWAHNTLQCSCDQYHQLEATFDGIMADEHGQLFIIERKTYSRKPSIEELDRKDQFLAYMWALQQSLPNAQVIGVAYDGLWKRDKPPAGKSQSDLFLRRILPRNQHELEEFGQLLALEALDMCNPNVHIYKNELVLGGCWDCNFRPLCDAQSRGENLVNISNMYHRVDRKEWRHTRDDESA